MQGNWEIAYIIVHARTEANSAIEVETKGSMCWPSLKGSSAVPVRGQATKTSVADIRLLFNGLR